MSIAWFNPHERDALNPIDRSQSVAREVSPEWQNRLSNRETILDATATIRDRTRLASMWSAPSGSVSGLEPSVRVRAGRSDGRIQRFLRLRIAYLANVLKEGRYVDSRSAEVQRI